MYQTGYLTDVSTHFPDLSFVLTCCLHHVNRGFDYYGVTFDHLVPADDDDPEVLHVNIIELEAEEGLYANGIKYANETLSFEVHPLRYLGKKVLAVPRCCQKRLGRKDRVNINEEVIYQEKWLKERATEKSSQASSV